MNSKNAIRHLKVESLVRVLIISIAAAMVVYHVFVLVTGVPDPFVFRPVHVAFICAIGLLGFTTWGEHTTRGPDIYTVLLMIAAAYSLGYFALSLDRIVDRFAYVSPVLPQDRIAAVALIIVAFDVCRRTIGWTLPVLAIVVFLHAWLGGGPSFMNHPGVTADRLVDHLYLTTSGIFGSMVALNGTDIFAFTLFGSALILSKGNQGFMDIALRATRGSKGGPAKAAVIGSALFGTISGSAIANVYTTGSVTIPLMISRGFKPHVAGGFEATAGNVGNWMPPVMGTAAFLVADFTGNTYGYICLIAIVPALLYVLGLFASAHFIGSRMIRDGEVRLVEDERPESLRRILGTWWHLLLPILLLIVLLAMEMTSYIAALWTTCFVLVVAQFRSASRFTFQELLDALYRFAMAIVPISAAMIVSGLIVSGLEVTGVTLKFASAVTSLTGGNLHATLILVAVSGIILGMGLPGVAAYVVTMIFGVQALTELGVNLLVAHMFIFYFANLSSLTPPVALASFAAASVANASVWSTSMAAMRLAIPAFILPFIIAYNPVLLLQGEVTEIVLGVMSAVIAVLILASATEAWFLGRPVGFVLQMILFVAGVCLMLPSILTDAIGVAILIAIAVGQIMAERRQRKLS